MLPLTAFHDVIPRFGMFRRDTSPQWHRIRYVHFLAAAVVTAIAAAAAAAAAAFFGPLNHLIYSTVPIEGYSAP